MHHSLYMEGFVEKMGVWTVTAIVAVVVVAYAYFASYELHTRTASLSQAPAKAISANFK